MNRNRIANNLFAQLARPVVALNRGLPCGKPALSAVGGYSADPQMGVLAGGMRRHVFRVALLRTKTQAGFCRVLTRNPRLYPKRRGAVGALVKLAFYEVHQPRLFARECVGGPFPLAPVVADLVVVRHGSGRHVPFAATSLAAETGAVFSVRLHVKRGAANLASLSNHDAIIPRNTGDGTTGVAADMFAHEVRDAYEVTEQQASLLEGLS